MPDDPPALPFAEVVATGLAVAATTSRTAKTAAIAALLHRTPAGDRRVVVGMLVGELRQGRIGVGWAGAFGTAVEPAATSSLSVRDVDDAVEQLAGVHGPGSMAVRQAELDALFGRATGAEADYLRRLFVGELRHGALDAVVTEAIARADDVPLASVRRAAMLLGDLGGAAELARDGRAPALDAVGLALGRFVHPMLASPATDAADAIDGLGDASVEWKLDGIRIQVHVTPHDVVVYTRNGNDITDRVPMVASVARTLPVTTAVLDGEAMGDRPHFFDCLHLDGEDLLDRPLRDRLDALRAVAAAHCVVGRCTDDAAVVAEVAAEALAAGHEGVVVKALDSPYDAGRRGRSWRKVKPVRTFDLVVLGAEWGHGRRQGRLSNLHLGARDADGGFVMVGKTFKGLTDARLAWQTERFLALEVRRTAGTVFVRPEQVVEIALDGVQASTRYPGGVALRFARVKGYRDDKPAHEADTVAALRALLPAPPGD